MFFDEFVKYICMYSICIHHDKIEFLQDDLRVYSARLIIVFERWLMRKTSYKYFARLIGVFVRSLVH